MAWNHEHLRMFIFHPKRSGAEARILKTNQFFNTNQCRNDKFFKGSVGRPITERQGKFLFSPFSRVRKTFVTVIYFFCISLRWYLRNTFVNCFKGLVHLNFWLIKMRVTLWRHFMIHRYYSSYIYMWEHDYANIRWRTLIHL